MSQILCCPAAWILELRSIHCLLQARDHHCGWSGISLFCFDLMHTKVVNPKIWLGTTGKAQAGNDRARGYIVRGPVVNNDRALRFALRCFALTFCLFVLIATIQRMYVNKLHCF